MLDSERARYSFMCMTMHISLPASVGSLRLAPIIINIVLRYKCNVAIIMPIASTKLCTFLTFLLGW